MANKSTPKKFGILIFPGFEPLDAFGPLEALVMLSRKHQLELYMISVLDTLSPVSTAPPSSVYNPLNSSAFVSLVPTHTITSPPADLDVLLVPGGWGIEGPDIVPAIPWLASIQPTLNHALIGVCNGVSLLARAGILNGRRATTNKSLWDELIALGPTTEWDKDARWVKDGKVWTSAGVSAGIDATLAYIADTFGAELVRWITNVMEYERKEAPKPDRFALVDYNEFSSR